MKVLVPVDGSELCMKAVDMAVKLAEKEGAQVTLMTVVPYATWDFESLPTNLQAKFDAHAQGFLEKAKAPFDQKGLSVEMRLDYGINAGNNIVKLAEEGKFDLILLGSTGTSGLSRLLMGSTAMKVVQNAPCTVTVVR